MTGYMKLAFGPGTEADLKPSFQAAVDFWNTVIKSGAPPLTFPDGLEVSDTKCNTPYSFAPGETLDGLLVFAVVNFLDGEGGTLGMAAPCYMPKGQSFPRMAMMLIDQADAFNLLDSSRLAPLIKHEMGHTVGIGTMWQLSGLLENPCSNIGSKPCDPSYTGQNGIIGYNELDPTVSGSNPLVENTGGGGTANMHWREKTFDTELMTGYLDYTSNIPMSIMTVKALQDLGYEVDLSAADPFVLPNEVDVDLNSEEKIKLNDVMFFDLSGDEVPRIESKPGNNSFEALLAFMTVGFLLLVGFNFYMDRDVRENIDDMKDKLKSKFVENPMHKEELA